ncbi:phenylalanine--tRNA ligase subunit beta [Nitrococcus mobilis]|uniref:Phenylalanine--tRNA ligase beta subunit n=1 Tax=Nitrococcus mobilis Nb-231 TaxID=314278 RepID=A4BM72_9GAMM|nr:phenylalanine--tRNA ligase subunit beta [Nitrococcus mobilis]EAR23410.1 phenylalanyl-tRNA synthetase, beta subunit [Nitrococcus mobilis Nb-231]
MRISEQWLREWVAFEVPAAELSRRLTMAGLEVSSVQAAAPAFSGVIVGEIVQCVPHPNADRLKLCEVRAGDSELVSIVCGAPNARTGLKAPLAQVGAQLPDGLRIRQTRLRGEQSEGMLCSAKELGLADEAAGLLELPQDAPSGMDLRQYLSLDEHLIEVDLTPNRGDCLSMAGVAREVGVLLRKPVTEPSFESVAAVIDDERLVHLDAPADCPRYLGRIVRGVDARAPIPLWLRERLRRAGIRPLSAAVDVTNYVMLELGQPLHAFDLSTLEGDIRVRRAAAGEELALLNGASVELDEQTLVIADTHRPVALAGIMGGAPTAVTEQTRDLFLEAAFFAPQTIAGRARRYGLHTDSAHRFERGVDPNLPRIAMERATRLLIEIAGGRPGPVREASDAACLPPVMELTLRPARVAQLLGSEIPHAEMHEILERLGMSVTESSADAWSIRVPGYRFDIAREVDLIEEIARVWGYDELPARRAPAQLAMIARPERVLPIRRLRQLLIDRGYQEAITYSFVARELEQALDPAAAPIALANPISADLAVMRTSLWPGLIRALLHNQKRQHERVRLFETGLCFSGGLEALRQEPALAGIACGSAWPEQWGMPRRSLDFFDIKGDVEALLALTGESKAFRFAPEPHSALHPGQSARIYRGDRGVGWVGALHPRVQRTLELSAPGFVFELALAEIEAAVLPAFQDLSRYPSIRRDLAIVVDEAVAVQQVQDCIRAAAGENLREIVVFDLYRGQGVSVGRKSLAIGLILQDSSRTLTDREVEEFISCVVGQLRHQLKAELRE